ncbi:MAG: hypothetical protein FWF59_07265 [Turicibacter sp.]|nr:hypothetical protein [Turicibacter sp.]
MTKNYTKKVFKFILIPMLFFTVTNLVFASSQTLNSFIDITNGANRAGYLNGQTHFTTNRNNQRIDFTMTPYQQMGAPISIRVQRRRNSFTNQWDNVGTGISLNFRTSTTSVSSHVTAGDSGTNRFRFTNGNTTSYARNFARFEASW